MGLRLVSRLFGIAVTCIGLIALGNCDDSGSSAHADAAIQQPTGECRVGVEAGQPCNTVVNVATAITPTCTSAPLPVGTGGTITPGIYVLTAQTYYNFTGNCPTVSMAGTIDLSDSCIQQVVEFSGISLRASAVLVVQGNQITSALTCNSPGTSGFTPDTPTQTFTATPTTFTLFTWNSAVGNPNPDRAAVFVRQ